MVNNTKIKNIPEFLIKLNNLNKVKHYKFFRGHSDVHYDIVPKLFRKSYKVYLNEEHELLANAEINYPEELSTHNSSFEKIAIMQHYGIATRLLDLTENALVALYFACNEKQGVKGQDGAVILFKINADIIKYYNSDSVSILCAISKIDNKKIKNIAEEFKNELEKELNNINEKNEYPNILKLIKKPPQNQTIIESIRNRQLKQKEKELSIQILNKCSSIDFIVHEIGNEKPHFKKKIHFEDFDNRILCVRSKLSNERIKAQSGLFLLFGIRGADKTKCPKIGYAKHQENISYNKITIDKNYKKTIINELKILGISKSTIFPGLAYASEEILLR